MASLTTLTHINNAVQQNVDFNGRKPTLKKGSPAAKVAQGTNQIYRQAVGKTMTDAQLKHRKRLSAGTTIVTSTLGLGALGAKGGGALLRQAGKTKSAVRTLRKIPGLSNVKPKQLKRVGSKIENAAVPVSLVSGGISGVSGYNYASIQRAEARRRQQTTLNKAYDPEYNRQRRNQFQAGALAATGAGTIGGAGYYGYRSEKKTGAGVRAANQAHTEAHNFVGEKTAKYVKHKQNLQTAKENLERATLHREHGLANNVAPSVKAANTKKVTAHTANVEAKSQRLFRSENSLKAAFAGQQKAREGIKQAKRLRMIGRGKTGALALAGAGALGGAAYLHRKPRTSSWASYSPRYRPQS